MRGQRDGATVSVAGATRASRRLGRPARRVLAERPVGFVGIESAARSVGVSPSAIRLWERQGLVSPRRTDGGVRRYDTADVDRLQSIRGFRTQGLNAAAIRHLLAETGPTGNGRAAPARSATGLGSRASERLKALRLQLGLTLRDASDRSGLSVSFISSLERGVSGTTLATLRRLVAAYGVTVDDLVGRPPGELRRRVAAAERDVLEAAPGIRIENLFAGPTALESQLFVLAPGASSDGYYAHPGEEFMYVLAGSLGVWLDGSREFYELDPGDALTFPSTLEHRVQAIGRDETRVIWINTPPTF